MLLLLAIGAAVALPVLIVTSGCATVSTRAATGVGAFIDCESEHLDAGLLAEAKDLASSAIRVWITGDGHVDTAGLKSAAAPLKSDLMRCGFAGAIAALVASPPSNPARRWRRRSRSTAASRARRSRRSRSSGRGGGRDQRWGAVSAALTDTDQIEQQLGFLSPAVKGGPLSSSIAKDILSGSRRSYLRQSLDNKHHNHRKKTEHRQEP